MSAPDLSKRYECLRRRATEGGAGRRDGIVVLRQEGLFSWVEYLANHASNLPQAETPPARVPEPMPMSGDRSPLVCLYTDMLLATLLSREAR